MYVFFCLFFFVRQFPSRLESPQRILALRFPLSHSSFSSALTPTVTICSFEPTCFYGLVSLPTPASAYASLCLRQPPLTPVLVGCFLPLGEDTWELSFFSPLFYQLFLLIASLSSARIFFSFLRILKFPSYPIAAQQISSELFIQNTLSTARKVGRKQDEK